VLAAEAGLTRDTVIRALRGMGTRMRRSGNSGPDGVALPPDYWERLAAGYPDPERQGWVRRMARRWRRR